MRRLWMLALVVGTLSLIGGSAAAAQEATPAAASDRSEYVVPAAECVISTLLPSVLNSLATPAADGAASPVAAMAGDAPFSVPGGTPADAETATAVTAIFRQAWACQNAGNPSRYFSLLTEGELREGYTAEEVAAAFSVPSLELPAEEQTAVYAILGVTIHDDGRAGAYVVVDTVANPDPVEITYMLATETDAGWRIDDILTFSSDGSSM